MATANRVTHYSWGADYISSEQYVTFERATAGSKRTHNDPSASSWSRLMRVETLRRLKPKMKWFLRQHAMTEYIDRKVEEAKKKRSS